MKFKLEITVEYDKFKIPEGKSLSMINALQREQVAFAVEGALSAFKPEIHNVYKQRN